MDKLELSAVYRLYRILIPHLKPYRAQFVVAYLALFAATVMNLLKPWPLKIIFDYILLNKAMPHRIVFIDFMAGHDKLILLAFLCAGIVGIFLLEGLFTFTRKYFMTGAGERAINDIRQEVFGHLQMLGPGTRRSADFVVRLTSDIDSLKLLLTRHIETFVNYLFTFVGIGVTMFLMDWKLTLSALAVIPPLYLISLYFSVKVAELTRKKRAKESEVASLVQETEPVINFCSVLVSYESASFRHTQIISPNCVQSSLKFSCLCLGQPPGNPAIIDSPLKRD